MQGREKIFFIPTYIGPLKHYERLFPYLQDQYDVGFLIIRPDSPRRREMVEYCKEKKYTCVIIDDGIKPRSGVRIPFFTALQKRYIHSEACRDVLKRMRVSKIISHKAWSPYDTIFKEANRLGIETIVLQWSSDAGIFEHKIHRFSLLRWVYLYFLRFFSAILDLWYQEPRYGYTPAVPKKIGVFYEKKAQYYIEKGYDPHTVHIVGSPDIQLAHELKKKIDSNPTIREELFKKYSLDKNKIKILVILHRFYLESDERYRMTIEEHVAHHQDLFHMIREVFPEEGADIIFKMHPTENSMPEIYEPYKKLGVKLYHGQSKTEELLCLSDLCIGEPASSVNYMILGTGTPAIFVNFSEFQILNERMNYFYIKQIISDKDMFLHLLREFKKGTLEKQYKNSSINVNSRDNTVNFIRHPILI